jgi:peptidyl-tRNA hydrolase
MMPASGIDGEKHWNKVRRFKAHSFEIIFSAEDVHYFFGLVGFGSNRHYGRNGHNGLKNQTTIIVECNHQKMSIDIVKALYHKQFFFAI